MGTLVVIVVFDMIELNGRPDLKVWHKTVLDQEFKADSVLTNFTEYLELEKLAWNSLLPEYDSWKYGSFAINAGKQAHEITQEIQRQITAQEKAGTLNRIPPILAFQSEVDSKVTAPVLVHNLFERLPGISSKPGKGQKVFHELVLFDINRYAKIGQLMKKNPMAWINALLEQVTQLPKLVTYI